MAGAVGAIAGSLISSVVSSAVSSLVQSAAGLISQFGSQMVGDALGNLQLGKFGEAIKSVVNQLPMPNFAKDMINGLVDSVVESGQKDVEPECECAVEEAFGQQVQEDADLFAKNLENAVNETREEGKEGKGSEGKGQNWFTVLAKALGKIAGEHLDNMVELQDEMSGLTGKDDAGKMAETQAEFQAQSQMFKLASEATSTAVKSIGEGLSSLARKQ